MAVIAYIVDVAQATVFDWKEGYCATAPFQNRENCCRIQLGDLPETGRECTDWRYWTDVRTGYGLYVAIAAAYGGFAAGVTMLTARRLPTIDGEGKIIYMAGGSGIPEIKTILSGFVIKGFLSFKVLYIKAVGAVFAVASGMCLGKEGPFVHISACLGNVISGWFPKYAENDRKRREVLSAACAAGLSVAFGAPIGGVLFSFEVRTLE
ncbi:hypothetical protein ABW20_dc0100903 [Dactylellina cionopaga]|nr:hypothetical protein ABW20_dc0100903 [Dactylellina cionopaga]